jgi:cytochrome c-type biogenesis protein CcmH
MSRVAAILLALLLAGLAFSGTSHAVEPDEMLSDPVLEQRARDVSQHLRCLVCQNQSIDDSGAQLARDLRILVRERLTAGDTNEQAIGFIVARYGDFVLLKPPVTEQTYALWFGPLLLAVLGLGGIAVYFARRRTRAPEPLTPDERARLDELLRAKER